MKRTIVTLAITSAFTLLTIGLTGGKAGAVPPTRQTLTFNDTTTDTSTCPFPISTHAVDTDVITLFTDQGGNVVTSEDHVSGTTTYTNETTGTSITTPERFTFIHDHTTDVVTLVGVLDRFVLPGGGVLLLDAGRISFDAAGNVIAESGPHDFLDNPEALCPVLG